MPFEKESTPQKYTNAFTSIADMHGIPREHWDDFQVAGFVKTLEALGTVEQTASYFGLNAFLGKEDAPSPVDLGSSLGKRQEFVRSMVFAARAVLEDTGTDQRPFDPERTDTDTYTESDRQELINEGFEETTDFFGGVIFSRQTDEGTTELRPAEPIPNSIVRHLTPIMETYGLKIVPVDDKDVS